MTATTSQTYCVGGLRLALNLPDGPVAAAFASSWKAFAADGEASIEFDACRTESFAGEPLWVFPLPERLPNGTLRLQEPEYSAEATPDRRRTVFSGSLHRLAVENVLKVLLADWLLDQGGLLLHSAAVCLESRACLFIGPSGAGKSTLASLCASAGWQVLADELVAVRPTGRTYQCSGTPWNVGAPVPASLKLVGELAFAPENRLEPVHAGDLVRLMLANALMPDPSASGRAKMFRNASRLLERVPSARLHFSSTIPPTSALKARLDSPAAV